MNFSPLNSRRKKCFESTFLPLRAHGNVANHWQHVCFLKENKPVNSCSTNFSSTVIVANSLLSVSMIILWQSLQQLLPGFVATHMKRIGFRLLRPSDNILLQVSKISKYSRNNLQLPAHHTVYGTKDHEKWFWFGNVYLFFVFPFSFPQTYIGDMLLSINPFKPLNVYSDELRQRYQGKEKQRNPP